MQIGISLNPKKSLFAMEEGKLLGHIISKDGIQIDLAIVEVVQQLDFRRTKRKFSHLMGKLTF